MDTFTIRELRTNSGKLIHDAEKGKLAIVSKHGQPVFIAVPFTQELIELGVHTALAIALYKESAITLEKAAKLSKMPLETFIEKLARLKIPSVNYSSEELEQELKDFE